MMHQEIHRIRRISESSNRIRRISESSNNSNKRHAAISEVFFIDPYNDFISSITLAQLVNPWFSFREWLPPFFFVFANFDLFSIFSLCSFATFDRCVSTVKTGFSFAVKKLITKEDPKHIHQVLGSLSLISFVYRYVFASGPGLGFGKYVWLDIITVIVHTLLAFSSIIFHVLHSRIISRPLIIYEEYRLHAMTFTMRGTSVYLFSQLYSYLQIGPDSNLLHFLLLALVMAHHLVADMITKKHGSTQHTAVRVTGKDTEIYLKIPQLGYSYYQFLAIASHITICDSLANMGYNTHIAIQSSAFLMTLHRKGLIEWYVHGGVYSICLLASIYHIWIAHPSLYFFGLTAFAFALRCRFSINKYIIWFLFSIVTSPFLSEYVSQVQVFAQEQCGFFLNYIAS